MDISVSGGHSAAHSTGHEGLWDYLGHVLDADVSDNADDKPTMEPGKVDAYRFNTFYLETSKENGDDFFRKVVDPIWLDQSPSAHAQVFRSAMHKPVYAWRIMHRVTFVSRVLPEVHTLHRKPQNVHVALRNENLESVWELINRLKPFLRCKVMSDDDFDQAVTDVLERYAPRLAPFATELLHDFRAFYEVA